MMGHPTSRDLSPDHWVLDDGQWLHRPWWKVAINTALRAVQPWPRKLVVVTCAEDGPDDRPRAIGYQLRIVEHRWLP